MTQSSGGEAVVEVRGVKEIVQFSIIPTGTMTGTFTITAKTPTTKTNYVAVSDSAGDALTGVTIGSDVYTRDIIGSKITELKVESSESADAFEVLVYT